MEKSLTTPQRWTRLTSHNGIKRIHRTAKCNLSLSGTSQQGTHSKVNTANHIFTFPGFRADEARPHAAQCHPEVAVDFEGTP